MLSLSLYTSSIEQIVIGIADALNIDSAVIDSSGQLIACTKRYKLRKGSAVHPPFIQEVMKRGSVMVTNPGYMPPCEGCRFSHQCPATFEILSCINLHDTPVGVISITSFTKDSQRRLSKTVAMYVKLIEVMTSLIASVIDSDSVEPRKTSDIRDIITQYKNALLGTSPTINQLRSKLPLISRSDSSVLLTGETGTGKGHIAKLIHDMSPRSTHRMVSINCAGIPPDLLESELFGYEDGAFTGAKQGGKLGKFELASGGTLFLDEIGDMPIQLQPKLLKVLEDKRIERVGGLDPIGIDVRIIAATNANLEHKITEGEFRADLYYRLNVLPIHIPPLRERLDDIQLMIPTFLERHCRNLGRKPPTITNQVMSILTEYPWPGNIRQLENALEYISCMEPNSIVTKESLPDWILATKHRSVQDRLQNIESETIVDVLNKYGYDLKGKRLAAEELGIGLRTLYRKIKDYNL